MELVSLSHGRLGALDRHNDPPQYLGFTRQDLRSVASAWPAGFLRTDLLVAAALFSLAAVALVFDTDSALRDLRRLADDALWVQLDQLRQ